MTRSFTVYNSPNELTMRTILCVLSHALVWLAVQFAISAHAAAGTAQDDPAFAAAEHQFTDEPSMRLLAETPRLTRSLVGMRVASMTRLPTLGQVVPAPVNRKENTMWFKRNKIVKAIGNIVVLSTVCGAAIVVHTGANNRVVRSSNLMPNSTMNKVADACFGYWPVCDLKTGVAPLVTKSFPYGISSDVQNIELDLDLGRICGSPGAVDLHSLGKDHATPEGSDKHAAPELLHSSRTGDTSELWPPRTAAIWKQP